MTKAISDKGCDQESVVETKGINQGRILGCNTTLMSRRGSVDEATKEVAVEK